MEIIYNSQNEQHKKPFGAVKTFENVNFSILCSEESDSRIIFRNDDFSYNKSFDLDFINEEHGYFRYSISLSFDMPNIYFYRFEVGNASQIHFCGSVDCELHQGDFLPEWQLTVYDERFVTPDWLKGGIMYQIFPDRFKRSEQFKPLPAVNERVIHDDWFGTPNSFFDTKPYKAEDFFCGNLQGIIEQLDYIKELGINAIYLNPIFESAENHRYSAANYLNIDPFLGTNDDFVKLSKECRQRGIRIILDGVFNHTGSDSIYFNRYSRYDSVGAYTSVNSKYYDWYKFIKYPDKYECWWGFENLPKLNLQNETLSDFIAGMENSVLSFWHDKGCSGWRLDVADELPDAFLDKLRSTVKAHDSEAVIIGEVWEDASNKLSYSKRRKYLLGGQLDSAMNYPFRNCILDFVLDADSRLFKIRVMSILENYPQPVIDVLMNVLSTHDTVRILTQLGTHRDVKNEDKSKFRLTDEEYDLGKKNLKMAAFLQFTLPGVPCIYYGDEVGMQGFADPFCRLCYPYGKEDTELLLFYKALSKLRVDYREDFIHHFTLYYAENSVVAFKQGKINCFVNNSEKEKVLAIRNLSNPLLFNIEPVLTEKGITLPPKSFCAIA
jgi:cyclomaltodextrinase